MACQNDHATLETRFCPDCGEAPNMGGIHALRLNISKVVSSKQGLLDRAVKQEEQWRQDHEQKVNREIEHAVELRRATAHKWAGWLKLLDDLIEKAGA